MTMLDELQTKDVEDKGATKTLLHENMIKDSKEWGISETPRRDWYLRRWQGQW
jgi:hypothetical protein